jgi:hypothetical protein
MEGDADRMLAELVRVTQPGGRVVVSVRAIDIPWWVHVPVGAALKTQLDAPLDPWHVRMVPDAMNGLTKEAAVDPLQLRDMDRQRLPRKLGRVSPATMEEIVQYGFTMWYVRVVQ